MLDDKDLVCYCQEVTITTVKKAIASGVNDVETLIRETGAGMACGSCIETLEIMLEQK